MLVVQAIMPTRSFDPRRLRGRVRHLQEVPHWPKPSATTKPHVSCACFPTRSTAAVWARCGGWSTRSPRPRSATCWSPCPRASA
ncbi:hypothetical protein [Lysobacter gummosus]|uniref:hypothetical protein n=1 Tax=Lysobacter gummosus TaxID=262324 RepID=UPI00362FB4D3